MEMAGIIGIFEKAVKAVDENAEFKLIDDLMEIIIANRQAAREAKNWAIADDIRDKLKAAGIILDFHAEATSEKLAMGFYFDGKITVMWGTHTHVQTADSRILPQGTAYITDLGMVGANDSILGVKVEPVIEKFLTAMPVRLEPAEGSCIYCGIILDIDDKSNKVTNIERIYDEVQL